MSTESDAKTTPMVHVSISPNGDGVNDILLIDNIASYPENKLRLMSRNGEEIFSISGYDNASHIFDGHSSHGKLQQAGTYFYELEYKDSGKVKRLTGFFILKY
jgi:gliding motility-associated-like protein